ncbi:MAG: hypothetical protein KA179_12350 [Sulfuritalea sp.]|nr:hypothetical protein [Sulfuritalea sp.]
MKLAAAVIPLAKPMPSSAFAATPELAQISINSVKSYTLQLNVCEFKNLIAQRTKFSCNAKIAMQEFL